MMNSKGKIEWHEILELFKQPRLNQHVIMSNPSLNNLELNLERKG